MEEFEGRRNGNDNDITSRVGKRSRLVRDTFALQFGFLVVAARLTDGFLASRYPGN
jgi:hypothetical protein